MNDLVIGAPGWLYALFLIPVLVVFYHKLLKKAAPVLLFPATASMEHPEAGSKDPTIISQILQLAALSCIILALADIRSDTVKTTYRFKSDTDIMLALDISGSMMMEDLKPNRLEALKDVISGFVANRRNDRIGMVFYAGESLNACPLTRNSFYLIHKLNELEDQQLQDGTAIGLGLASAVNVLKSSAAKTKIVVLLTDGENNTGFIDPLTASSIARKNGIKVYTVGLGTNGLAPFPIRDMSGRKVYQYVPVKLDEGMLRKLALNTGGSYFRALDTEGLEAVYKAINKLERPVKEAVTTVSHVYYKKTFSLIAFCLLFISGVLRATYLKVFEG